MCVENGFFIGLSLFLALCPVSMLFGMEGAAGSSLEQKVAMWQHAQKAAECQRQHMQCAAPATLPAQVSMGFGRESVFLFDLKKTQDDTLASVTLRSIKCLLADQLRLLIYLTERTNWRYDFDGCCNYRELKDFLRVFDFLDQAGEKWLCECARGAKDFLVVLGGGALLDDDSGTVQDDGSAQGSSLGDATRKDFDACKKCMWGNWCRIDSLLQFNWVECANFDETALGDVCVLARIYPYQRRLTDKQKHLSEFFLADKNVAAAPVREPEWKQHGLSRDPFKNNAGAQPVRSRNGGGTPLRDAAQKKYGLFDLVTTSAGQAGSGCLGK